MTGPFSSDHPNIKSSIGNVSLVKLLLSAGASPCINRAQPARYQGRTPIQAAAEGGHEAVVQLLLDLGADINAGPSPSGGLTALQAACRDGDAHLALVQRLLAQGAAINAPAGRTAGWTALQAACYAGATAVVDVLLAHGADVNAPGSRLQGGPALHAAAAGGHVALVRRLLAGGADPTAIAGSRRQTAVQSAYVIGRTDIVEVLEGAGAVGPRAGGQILFRTSRIKVWSRDEMEGT